MESILGLVPIEKSKQSTYYGMSLKNLGAAYRNRYIQCKLLLSFECIIIVIMTKSTLIIAVWKHYNYNHNIIMKLFGSAPDPPLEIHFLHKALQLVYMRPSSACVL